MQVQAADEASERQQQGLQVQKSLQHAQVGEA
jgi:hypothetical protein